MHEKPSLEPEDMIQPVGPGAMDIDAPYIAFVSASNDVCSDVEAPDDVNYLRIAGDENTPMFNLVRCQKIKEIDPVTAANLMAAGEVVFARKEDEDAFASELAERVERYYAAADRASAIKKIARIGIAAAAIGGLFAGAMIAARIVQARQK